MPEDAVIAQTPSEPATESSLARDFASIGVSGGSILLVHASLSSLGWVCGGAIAVINALLSAVGENGTLVMPSHSADNSEPSAWCNPPVPEHWWPIIRNSMPAFDAKVTPTRGMGKIADNFRSYPGVRRSGHPQTSFAAFGPQAEAIISNHPLEDGLGRNSPLGRLYELRASVLLLGVEHNRNTSLHLSEIKAYGEHIARVRTGAAVLRDGKRQWVEFDQPLLDDSRFPAIGREFQRETGLVSSGRVAHADAMLMPQRELVDFGTQWLRDRQCEE